MTIHHSHPDCHSYCHSPHCHYCNCKHCYDAVVVVVVVDPDDTVDADNEEAPRCPDYEEEGHDCDDDDGGCGCTAWLDWVALEN